MVSTYALTVDDVKLSDDGVASNPTIYFASDPTSGIYHDPITNSFNISSAGINRMSISGTGVTVEHEPTEPKHVVTVEHLDGIVAHSHGATRLGQDVLFEYDQDYNPGIEGGTFHVFLETPDFEFRVRMPFASVAAGNSYYFTCLTDNAPGSFITLRANSGDIFISTGTGMITIQPGIAWSAYADGDMWIDAQWPYPVPEPIPGAPTGTLSTGYIEIVPNGTAGTPSLYFYDDRNSGLWRDSDNSLNWSTRGVTRLSIADSGVSASHNVTDPTHLTTKQYVDDAITAAIYEAHIVPVYVTPVNSIYTITLEDDIIYFYNTIGGIPAIAMLPQTGSQNVGKVYRITNLLESTGFCNLDGFNDMILRFEIGDSKTITCDGPNSWVQATVEYPSPAPPVPSNRRFPIRNNEAIVADIHRKVHATVTATNSIYQIKAEDSGVDFYAATDSTSIIARLPKTDVMGTCYPLVNLRESMNEAVLAGFNGTDILIYIGEAVMIMCNGTNSWIKCSMEYPDPAPLVPNEISQVTKRRKLM